MKQPSPFASVLLLSIPILFIIQGLEYKFISSTNSWGAAERISVWLLTVFYRFSMQKKDFCTLQNYDLFYWLRKDVTISIKRKSSSSSRELISRQTSWSINISVSKEFSYLIYIKQGSLSTQITLVNVVLMRCILSQSQDATIYGIPHWDRWAAGVIIRVQEQNNFPCMLTCRPRDP